MRLEPLRGRFEFTALPLRTELRVDNRAFMAIRIAEMHPRLGRAVQLVSRCVVTDVVASAIGEPKLPRRRMPVETDGISHAAREHFKAGAVRFHAHDCRVWIAAVAHVARRTDRYVEKSVGTEADELPSVMPVDRQLVGDNRRRTGVLQLRLDVVEADDAIDLRYIQRTVPERHAVRHVPQAADDGDDAIGLAVFVIVAQRVDAAGVPRAGENGAAWALCERPHVAHAVGPHGNLESWWQLDFRKLHFRLGR